jgi:hypothetical protein
VSSLWLADLVEAVRQSLGFTSEAVPGGSGDVPVILPATFTNCPICGRLITVDADNPTGACTKDCGGSAAVTCEQEMCRYWSGYYDRCQCVEQGITPDTRGWAADETEDEA